MNCDEVKKQLALMLYGELTFDEEEAVEQHMDGCVVCRAELSAQRRLHQTLDDQQAEVPDDLLDMCRQDLHQRVLTAGAPAIPFWRRIFSGWSAPSATWLKPAGALALVAFGFFAARLTTVPNRAGVASNALVEPVTSRVRTIESAAGGGIQLVVEETRQRVLQGRLEDEQIRHLLLGAAKDPSDPGLRVESVELLMARPESTEIRTALLTALRHDPNPGVRLKAIEGLHAFGADPETRKILAQVLLADDNPGVRTQAIDLLMQKKEPEVVGLLQELLRKEDSSYVRLRSQKALREMNASVETF
jgi:hypothetical protein